MLLKQLIQQTSASANLLFRDPFARVDPEQLVKEVIGLANADAEGPRYIIFGMNLGAMEGSGVVGIADSAMADLKKAHRAISQLVQPLLELAFIFDKIEGKLVGALEIGGCHEAPYAVRKAVADRLTAGESWIMENRRLRAASADDLDAVKQRTARAQTWDVSLGFNTDPLAEVLELHVPDRSELPSMREKEQVKKTFDWKSAAKDALGTVNTSIMRLLHVRDNGPDTDFDTRGIDTLIASYKNIGTECSEADKYYLFEVNALKVNLTVLNRTNQLIKGAEIEIVFPRIADFDVSDRLFADPDAVRAGRGPSLARYPDVTCTKDAYIVRAALGDLAADQPVRIFEAALRLVVGPKMTGQKIALRYTLRANNKPGFGRGRLKLVFREAPAPIALELEDAVPALDGGDPYNTMKAT
jgi:hypothetical protein